MVSPHVRDRGAAVVEFALMLPLMLLLISGIIDFGRMLNAQISATEAAREAARAVTLGATTSEADDRVEVLFGAEDSAVTVVNTGCPANATALQDGRVTVTHQFQFITPIGALADILPNGTTDGSLTLTGVGVMPCHA